MAQSQFRQGIPSHFTLEQFEANDDGGKERRRQSRIQRAQTPQRR
jgi:hypothetical protein